MKFIAVLSPTSYIAQAWGNSMGGNVCGALFHKKTNGFVAHEFPDDSLQRLIAHPMVTVVSMGEDTVKETRKAKTAKEANQPEPSEAVSGDEAELDGSTPDDKDVTKVLGNIGEDNNGEDAKDELDELLSQPGAVPVKRGRGRPASKSSD